MADRNGMMSCSCRRLVHQSVAFYTMNHGTGGLYCLFCADESTYRLFEFSRPLRWVIGLPLYGLKAKYLRY